MGDAMDVQAIWRTYRQIGACRQAKTVEIEGVIFDLAHPDPDRAQWEPTTLLGSLPQADQYTRRLVLASSRGSA